MNHTINFKHGRQAEEFALLRHKNPALYAMVVASADFAWREFRQWTTITSIYRPGVDSVHAWWRGVDVRIYHPSRWPDDPVAKLRREDEEGWSEEAAYEIAEWLDRWIWYDDALPEDEGHEVIVVHGVGMERHAHLQLGPWSVDT